MSSSCRRILSCSLFKELGVLVGVYAGFRMLFFFAPGLKGLLFIQPTGYLVEFFWGTGVLDRGEWIYQAGDLRIRFGELCSGTTFFSLLSAYTAMKCVTRRLSVEWLAACYPLTLLTNAARVLCSMYVYAYSAQRLSAEFNEYLHLALGVTVFALSFIALTLFWERKTAGDDLGSATN